jgi:hypothetical protein
MDLNDGFQWTQCRLSAAADAGNGSFSADRHRLTSAYSVETNILLTDA